MRPEPIATYSFTVIGNQENATGNPIPYLRMTQKSLWTNKAKRYLAFKDYIVTALLTATPEHRARFDRAIVTEGKPITLEKNQIAFTDVVMHWAPKGLHADPDNIVKAVNDALFNEDRNVYPRTQPGAPLGHGQIDITISVYTRWF